MNLRGDRTKTRHGSAALGLLIVLVIIFILFGQGYLKRDERTGETEAEQYIDRSKAAACTTNRQALAADLTRAAMSGGGRMPSIGILRVKLGHYRCPGEGEYFIDDQSNVYCTQHAPPPDGAEVHALHPDEAAATP